MNKANHIINIRLENEMQKILRDINYNISYPHRGLHYSVIGKVEDGEKL